ncbi:MAG TPA: hypothetical protein VM686_42755 [Polyangiaceae bacterium]|nr:hypothetical protein [Polyangiaceae bacterium]
METVVLWVLKGSLFLSVLALGLRATTRDATHLLRQPEPLARALLSMNGVMALVAVVMIASYDFHPVVKLALGAIAVSPVPPLLPRRALKAGGQTSYTVGLLVAAALASIVMIPLSMAVLQRLFHVPLRMSAVSVALLALATVLAPLAAGMLVRRLAPSLSAHVARPLGAVAMALLLASLVPVLYAARHDMGALIGNGTLAAFIIFSVIGLGVGHVLGRPDGENRVVLALCTATRHPAMAIAIAHTNFPDEKRAPAAVVLYFLVTALVSGLYLAWYKRASARTAVRREQH